MKDNALLRLTRNDYAFTVFTKIAAMVIGVIASAFGARYLGAALKGENGYITALITTVSVIANFGLYQPYPFHKRQQEPDVLGKFLNIFALQFLVYAVIGIVLALCLNSFALVAVCLIAPIQVFANQLSFLVMVEHVRYKNVVFLTARITNTLLIILAFCTLKPMLLVSLGLIVVGNLITVVMVLRKFGRVGNPFKADLGFLRKIWGFGLVAMITTLLLTLNYRLDVMMLKWLGVMDAQRGFYDLGISLAEYGWVVSDAFREVLFSRTARSDAIADVSFSLRANFYITLLMIAVIALLGRPAIGLVYGAEYLPAFRVTLILLSGILSMSYFKLIGTLLLAQGRKTMYLVMLAVSVLVNIIANWLTIPLWGIEGAAMASVLSYTVAGAVFLIYFVRTYKVRLATLFVFQKGEIPALLAKLRRH